MGKWEAYISAIITWHLGMLPLSMFTGLVMLIYACMYKKNVVQELPQESIPNHGPDFDSWREREVGLFGCCRQPDQCLWATFCTPGVAAKNYQVAGVMGFWPSCLCLFAGTFSMCWPFFCAVALFRTIMSAKLKKNLGFRPVFLKDFLISLFCFPCEVGRESMEVDHRIGVKISCPFKVDTSVMTKVELVEEGLAQTSRACMPNARACKSD